jgi:hypothetical protein
MILAACTSPTVTPTRLPAASPTHPPDGLTSITATAPVQPAATLQPSHVLLVAPSGADADIEATLQSTLTELAKPAGFSLETRDSLVKGDLDGSVRLVVALPPFSGFSDLVSQAPQIQFVAVGMPGLTPAVNLTVIGKDGFVPDQQAFMAGYIAAIMTPDWRVGVLAVDSPDGQLVGSAFENGARYFCGLCKPMFPPYYLNQEIAHASATTDGQAWKTAADLLIARSVQTVYIDPVFHSADLLKYLSDAKLDLLSGTTPSAALLPQWVATVRPDPSSALRQVWNDLLAGKGGQQLAMPLAVMDTQSGLLSAARMRLVQETLDNLVSGSINPDSLPSQ